MTEFGNYVDSATEYHIRYDLLNILYRKVPISNELCEKWIDNEWNKLINIFNGVLGPRKCF